MPSSGCPSRASPGRVRTQRANGLAPCVMPRHVRSPRPATPLMAMPADGSRGVLRALRNAYGAKHWWLYQSLNSPAVRASQSGPCPAKKVCQISIEIEGKAPPSLPAKLDGISISMTKDGRYEPKSKLRDNRVALGLIGTWYVTP